MGSKVEDFTSLLCDDGSGNGSGSGYGSGNGYGNGYGSGYGYGKGKGNGNGNGNGNGKGNGSGYGYGNGNGKGNGSGYGDGYGDGNGNGYGDGYGYGYGIKSINGQKVHSIDGVTTIVTQVRNNVAKGFIVKDNFSFTPCYIVQDKGYYAHGETLQKAFEDVRRKIIRDMDIDEKCEEFIKRFPSLTDEYPVKDFYEWHGAITGSCEMGRKEFASSHEIDIDKDTMTVKEFLKLTENAYGGEVIKQLAEKYREEK